MAEKLTALCQRCGTVCDAGEPEVRVELERWTQAKFMRPTNLFDLCEDCSTALQAWIKAGP